ncbi:hypothetical protein QE152_g24352 [Popillia japonica]|uniref:Uncharacterized protein n=1 Tax=Popillia japonica TaxID=7064 RepID=A0AAW1KC08_POPJA
MENQDKPNENTSSVLPKKEKKKETQRNRDTRKQNKMELFYQKRKRRKKPNEIEIQGNKIKWNEKKKETQRNRDTRKQNKMEHRSDIPGRHAGREPHLQIPHQKNPKKNIHSHIPTVSTYQHKKQTQHPEQNTNHKIPNNSHRNLRRGNMAPGQ